MKHRLLIWLFAFSAFTAAAQEFKSVQNGIEHARIVRQVKINDQETAPVVVNLLRLDLTKARLDVVHAMDAAIGLEKTSSIAARQNAIAAINAGFFRLDKSIFAGDATGVLKIDKTLLSESYAGRIALLIANKRNQTEIAFEHINSQNALFINKRPIQFVGTNRQRGENDLVVYLPSFHRTTLTDADGVEAVVRKGKVVQLLDRAGNTVIPKDGFVLSASGEKREELLRIIKAKRKLTLKITLDGKPDSRAAKNYFEAEDAVGGVPQLIKNNHIEITWQAEKVGEKFAVDRHPRTAIAKLKDGKALLVTVDGRQPGISAGMNLPELAEMLLELGATDAMNLDGGGSTTMFVNGKVVNQPSDKEGERAVSDAILVTLRK